MAPRTKAPAAKMPAITTRATGTRTSVEVEHRHDAGGGEQEQRRGHDEQAHESGTERRGEPIVGRHGGD